MALKYLENLQECPARVCQDSNGWLPFDPSGEEVISSTVFDLESGDSHIDEQRVLEISESPSADKRRIERLEAKKANVKKWVLAGDSVQIPGNKRKRPEYENAGRPPKEKESISEPTPVATKKENATLAQRIEVLDWYHTNGKNQSATARHFAAIYLNLQIKQPLVSYWVKEEAKWRTFWAEGIHSQVDRSAKRIRQTEHPEISEMMHLWLSKAMGDGISLSGEVIRQQWNRFADLAGIPQNERLRLSNGWLERFRARNGLEYVRRRGEVTSGAGKTAEDERKRTHDSDLIQKGGYELRNIFNIGLCYSLFDGEHTGVKGNKIRLTYAFTTNADGSEKFPPFIIGNAPQSRVFNGAELGIHYRHNAKGWMTTHLYQDWILQWDRELQAQNRKILLLQDFSHIVPPGLQNIRVENLKPNPTGHVQPNEGIIRCFKAHYRMKFIRRAMSRYNEGNTNQIYDISQLEAMGLADAAWREVDTTAIRNCWQRAGILSTSSSAAKPLIPISSLLHDVSLQMDPIAHAEKEVELALDDLIATGAVREGNQVGIEFLLNPTDKFQSLMDASDKDIYEAVMDAIRARESLDGLPSLANSECRANSTGNGSLEGTCF